MQPRGKLNIRCDHECLTREILFGELPTLMAHGQVQILVKKTLTEQLPDSEGRRGFSFLGRCMEGGSEACTHPTISIPRPWVFI